MYFLALQFEREDEGKLQEILVKDNLQSLYPLAGIQSYLPAVLTEVMPLLWDSRASCS